MAPSVVARGGIVISSTSSTVVGLTSSAQVSEQASAHGRADRARSSSRCALNLPGDAQHRQGLRCYSAHRCLVHTHRRPPTRATSSAAANCQSRLGISSGCYARSARGARARLKQWHDMYCSGTHNSRFSGSGLEFGLERALHRQRLQLPACK